MAVGNYTGLRVNANRRIESIPMDQPSKLPN
jgi:hypothetical protein